MARLVSRTSRPICVYSVPTVLLVWTLLIGFQLSGPQEGQGFEDRMQALEKLVRAPSHEKK